LDDDIEPRPRGVAQYSVNSHIDTLKSIADNFEQLTSPVSIGISAVAKGARVPPIQHDERARQGMTQPRQRKDTDRRDIKSRVAELLRQQ